MAGRGDAASFADCLRLRELADRQTLREQDGRDLAAIADRLHALLSVPVVVIRPYRDYWNIESLDGAVFSTHETDAQAIAWIRSWKWLA